MNKRALTLRETRPEGARIFAPTGGRSVGSHLVEFLVRRVLRLRSRYERLVLSGPGFSREQMLCDRPGSKSAVGVEDIRLDAGRAYRYSPSSPASPGLIFYVHGGGFVEGPTIAHHRFAERICEMTQRPLVLVDYPKAPEHSPEQIQQAIRQAYDTVSGESDAERIVVMGDSAGANLSLILAADLRDEGATPPRALLLMSPCFDLQFNNPEMPAIEADDPFLSIDIVQRMGRAYAGERSLTDPKLSPLFADPAGLPPMSIFMGTRDILWPDTLRYLDHAGQAGADIDYYEFPQMMHAWMLFSFAEAGLARTEIARLITTALDE